MYPNRKLVRQMQDRLLKIQEELSRETVEGSAGGGAVVVVVSGDQKVQAVKIDPEAVSPEDVEMLEDLVLAATNEALAKSQELAAKRLGALTGGLKIPGLL